MIKRDYLKIFISGLKILFAAVVVVMVGANGFLFSKAYFTIGVTGTSLPSQTGYWGPPTITLLSPNGGNSLYQGNNYSINWNATTAVASSDPILVNIYYSTDGGATYTNTITTNETNDGIYNWTAPNIFSSTVKIKVVATDAHALSSSDESNASFSIVSPIVLNEFLPNPSGLDDAAMPGGEWVELRNNGSVAVNINGWVLYDAIDTHELVVNTTNSDNNGNPSDAGETVINPGGFLVVYRNGDGDFALNNTGGDSVRLYNAAIGSGGILIDSHIYTVDAPDNKSFARIPDGTGPWIDPIPTPGQPNTLDESESNSTPTPSLVPQEISSPTPLPTIEPTPSPIESSTPTSTPVITEESPEPETSSSPTPSETPTETATPSPENSPIPAPTEESSPIPTP